VKTNREMLSLSGSKGGKAPKHKWTEEASMRWLIRRILATYPLTLLQRCCLCGKLGVREGIHSYMGVGYKGRYYTRGKTCMNCFIDLLTEK